MKKCPECVKDTEVKKKGFFKITNVYTKAEEGDFPGGAVVRNPPASAGDTGSSPGPGRSHMPRSN